MILSKTPCGLSPPSPVPFWTILLESPAAEQHPKNMKKWTPKPEKIDVRGGLGGSGGGLAGDLAPSWLQVAFGSRFGHFWLALEGPSRSQDGPKRRQEEPSWGQDGGMLRPRGAKKHPRGATWRHVGSFLANLGGIFGTSCRKGCKAKNLEKL